MKQIIPVIRTMLIVIEGVTSFPVFLLSWWACSVYRSLVLGWVVSGQTSDEKRATIDSLLGR